MLKCCAVITESGLGACDRSFCGAAGIGIVDASLAPLCNPATSAAEGAGVNSRLLPAEKSNKARLSAQLKVCVALCKALLARFKSAYAIHK